MKLTTLSIASLFVIFLNSAFSQKENNTHCSKRDRQTTQLKSASLTVSQIAETEKYDVHFYLLDLNMTNISTYLSGKGSFKATALQAIDSVLYELFPTLTITSIKVNGVSVGFNRVGSAVKVPVNLASGANFTIETTYNGTPPTAITNPLGGGGLTYDTSPSWGNHVVWSLSEPFSAYEWFPCKQSLTDKADSCQVKLTVPDTCKAGSNGLLENIVSLGNGTSRYEWKHRHPIDYYLISVAVAKYVDYTIYANPIGAPAPIMIQNYIYNNPATLPNFQADINETADFIELFYGLFGPYPFEDEKYGHCMAPISGGMEHQTMTTQGFFNKTLTSHELAHQWWGDHVTCASWSDIWLNEGFASYCEYLMLENLYPIEKDQFMLDVHSNVMTQVGGSVWVLDSLNENRIFSGRLSYDKGSGIIHTMRYMMNNDSLFFATLKNYQTTFSNSTANGVDFRDVAQTISGVNFTPYFEQWYFGEGYPTYSVRWRQVGNDAIIRITHTASKPSITPTFTNPISLKIARQGLQDTTIRFDISANSNDFLISNLGLIGNNIIVDPANWVINNFGSVVQDNTLNLQESIVDASISVVPNPNNGVFTLNGLNETGIIHVYHMNGHLIKEMSVEPNQIIDLKGTPKGTYLISITLSKGNKTLRLITI